VQPAVNDPAAPRREEAAVPPDGDLGFGRGWCAADVAGGAAAVEPATVPGAVAGVWGQGQVGVETGAAHRRTSLSFGGYQNARPPWDGAGSQGKADLVDPSRVLPRPVSSSSPTSARPGVEIVPSAALLRRPPCLPKSLVGAWGQVGVETGAAHRRTSLSFGGYQNARPPWDGAGSQGKVNLVDPSRVLPRPVSSSSPARPAAEIVPSAALLCRPPRMPKLVAGVWGEVGLETGLEID
jgi:hypothetical protein